MAQGEREDALLGELARLVGHPRWPALARPEHLEARTQDRAPPAVVGRGVDPHRRARRPDVAELGRQAEQPQPEPEQDVIIDIGAAPPAHRFEHDKHGATAPVATWSSASQVSGELGHCSG
jgi:hypothetical protein